MRDECIQAVTAAAGRSLTQVEIKDIEDRVKRNQRLLAQIDRQRYLGMTPDQRLQEAAKLAAQELANDVQKKKVRTALTIQKHDAIDNYMKGQKAKYGMSGMESLERLLAFNADGKSNVQSVETRAYAIGNDFIRQLVETFESISPKMLGMFANKEGVRALTYELFGQDSSAIVKPEVATMAKKAAKAWTEVSESARKQFNSAGGQIGRLEDWHYPQSHAQRLVADAGQAKWTADIFGKLNRSKYVKEDGSMMNDQEVLAFINNVWTTIATGGANKIEPGKITGRGMLANANAEERSIHFKDADSLLAYQAQYGNYDAYTAMMKHITGISKDISLIETMGPNPDLQFKYWLDKSIKDDSQTTPKKSGKIESKGESLQSLYDYIAGKNKPIANHHIAQGFDTLRNWLVSTRLGSAYITSITDNATMQVTAAVNGMSHMQLLRNQLQTLNMANHDELRMARRAGLSLQTLIGEMNRWGADSFGPSFSAKMANLTVRSSLLNAATEARRRAFGVTMYGSIGNTVRKFKDIASLEKHDKRLMQSKGIDDTTFSIWKKAQLEDWGSGNDTMLTPEAIYKIADPSVTSAQKRDAALKLMGMVNEEVNMAVIEPGAREKAMMGAGLQRGTWKGEIMRSFFLFKSFPTSMIMRHWARGINMGTAGGKALYIGSFIAGTTVLGAAAQQISQILSGKDPQDMTKAKFLATALLKGGSLGIYGDFLLNTNTQYGSSPLGVLAGPVAGYAEDLIGLTQGAAIRAAKGEKVDFGANLIKFIKTNIPLQNLWYTKAGTDRMFFNQLQEIVSPGYMRRVEQRAQRDFGQSYYWSPGDIAPSRPPNFAAAFGQ